MDPEFSPTHVVGAFSRAERRTIGASVLMNLVAAFAFAGLAAETTLGPFVLQWLGFVVIVSLIRTILLFVARDATLAHGPIGAAGFLVTAGLWSALAWRLLPVAPIELSFSLIIIVAGLAAGATGLMAARQTTGRIYIVLMLVPASLLLLGVPGLQVIGALGFVDAGVMLVVHRVNYQHLVRAARLSRDNDRLVGEVLEANRRLEQRVEERTRALDQMVRTDPLTGAVNRRGLMMHFTENPDLRPRSVAFIDIDKFKQINTSLGHEAGDDVAVEVSRRLTAACAGNGLVVRWGGDEFVCVSRVSAAELGEAIEGAFQDDVHVGGHAITVKASIGVTQGMAGQHEIAGLIAEADLAASEVKAGGGAGRRLYTPRMSEAKRRFDRIVLDLPVALATEQLQLYYQPIVRARDHAPVAREALLRWQHPTLGMLAPDEFVAVAEDSNFIGLLGGWVLRQAAHDLRAWQDEAAGCKVAVNISVRQLLEPSFVPQVTDLLARTGLPASLFDFEVTETVFHPSHDKTMIANLRAVRALGAGISIDDFGTGYSSLSRVGDFPISQIKIDRRFTQSEDPRKLAVVEAAVTLAGRFGQSVVCEGVETIEQAQRMTAMGVDELQGYYFGRPQPLALGEPRAALRA